MRCGRHASRDQGCPGGSCTAAMRMTKSFKMVLLRVLLENDTVFSGMPIPELAAK